MLKRIFNIKKKRNKQVEGILDLLLCYFRDVHKWTRCVTTCLVYILSCSLIIWQGLFIKVNPTRFFNYVNEWLIYSKHILQFHCNLTGLPSQHVAPMHMNWYLRWIQPHTPCTHASIGLWLCIPTICMYVHVHKPHMTCHHAPIENFKKKNWILSPY